MEKTKALLELLALSEAEFSEMSSSQLRDWLGSLRHITRIVEHELLSRDREYRQFARRFNFD